MTQKIEIEELPVTGEFRRQRRLIEARGELALIEDGRSFRHLGYFSLRRGRNFYRGGHYHRSKVEHFYLIRGRITVRLVDLETGKRVTIHPGCAHRFEATADAHVIEYYDSLYDPEDDIRFTDF
jgi:mannose-6-phosphate isomerase-like protein (cupin superfamily)